MARHLLCIVDTNFCHKGQSKDIPTLLDDAKVALEYLAELPSETLGGDLCVKPTTIAKLGTLAETTRAELDGKCYNAFSHTLY